MTDKTEENHVATHSKFSAISICTGTGMFDHGVNLALAGAFEPILVVEREAFCCALLDEQMEQDIFSQAHIWHDVKTVTRPSVRAVVRARLGGERLDFIIGGIPCQPHSSAGKRLGAMDERDLWPATLAAIACYQPRFVFIENVEGISSNIDGARRIICDLAQAGYRAKAGLFSSKECGASMLRKRWFFLGIAENSNECGPRECENGFEVAFGRSSGGVDGAERDECKIKSVSNRSAHGRKKIDVIRSNRKLDQRDERGFAPEISAQWEEQNGNGEIDVERGGRTMAGAAGGQFSLAQRKAHQRVGIGAHGEELADDAGIRCEGIIANDGSIAAGEIEGRVCKFERDDNDLACTACECANGCRNERTRGRGEYSNCDSRLARFECNQQQRWGNGENMVGAQENLESEEDERQRGWHAAGDSGSSLPHYAPARNDWDAWLTLLSARPELSPSIYPMGRKHRVAFIARSIRGIVAGRNIAERRRNAKTLAEQIESGCGEEGAESAFRGVSDGMAYREHELRAIGNGVDSLAAAYAFVTLWAACAE